MTDIKEINLKSNTGFQSALSLKSLCHCAAAAPSLLILITIIYIFFLINISYQMLKGFWGWGHGVLCHAEMESSALSSGTRDPSYAGGR